MNKKPKVIAIIGPTAAGKTSLSIEIAKLFDGEVVSADSRQVYRGMDLGTGKVTEEEMRGIPHHLLDVAEPMDNYTAANFERDAKVAISRILSKNKLPIIAGGTYFYIELLRGNIQSAPVPPNEKLRDELESKSTEELFSLLKDKSPERAAEVDQYNKRRLIRSLEIIDTLGHIPKTKKAESDYDWLLLGVNISKDQLHKNINIRLHQRLEEGMIEEVERLVKEGVTHQRLEDFGLEYRFISQYLQGKITREEMEKEIEFKSRQYAKRQMTWLKKEDSIKWVNPKDLETVEKIVTGFLNN